MTSRDFDVLVAVGVRHLAAQKLYAKVRGERALSRDCVISEFLLHLADTDGRDGFARAGAVYTIPRNECPPAFVEEMREDLVAVGIPYLERFQEDDDILREMERHWGRGHHPAEWFLPIFLFLAGRHDEARRVAEDGARKSVLRKTEEVVRSRERLMELLAGSEGSGHDQVGR